MAVPIIRNGTGWSKIYFISLNRQQTIADASGGSSASNGMFFFVKLSQMLRKDANSTVVTSPFIIKNYGHMDVSLTQ